MKSIFWRLVMLGGFTLLALILFLPSTKFAKSLPSFWADNIPKIVLGLDLQGGMHLVLDVDQDEAVENYTGRLAEAIEALFKKEGTPFTSIKSKGASGVEVAYAGDDTAIRELIGDEYPLLDAPTAEEGRLLFSLNEAEVRRVRDWATTQALETIRNRIDKFGVTEPLIQRQGERELLIQLPGLKDPERALELIGRTAVLEFKVLDEKNDPYEAVDTGIVPFGSELLYQRVYDSASGAVLEERPYLVKSATLLTGDLLSDARVAFDSQFNEPYVSLTFDSNGARIFERITEKYKGKRLAIVLDGKVHSAPVIRERIAGGRAQISGSFAYEEATDLAIVLRAGALPASVNILQNVTVGPTLGRDSIEAGIKAVVLGGLLVLAFMIFYYRVSGVIADVAMVLNLIMLLGAMAYFNATLTLPGIAGIILTIGMGVDSNVLIFERIKEELRAGRTPRSAVDAGYDKAWWTIVDSHVTTLITAAVLFQFGSGPIKGFAVSLSLGILINLFTALVGTKVAFDIQNLKLKVKSLSI
ncbi:MAG: protein translocase subunit SecD [Thermodesulfobacteriota bacterium]